MSSSPTVAATSTTTPSTLTVGTPSVVFSSAAAGIFQLSVDLNPLAAGDVLELRVRRITCAGGSKRVVYFKGFAGAQAADDMTVDTPPMATALTTSGAVEFELFQTAGTGRAVQWTVTQL